MTKVDQISVLPSTDPPPPITYYYYMPQFDPHFPRFGLTWPKKIMGGGG